MHMQNVCWVPRGLWQRNRRDRHKMKLFNNAVESEGIGDWRQWTKGSLFEIASH